ncbi:MAG: glycosyltransferase [Bacteroidota bacterium]
MKILIVNNTVIPITLYGGTERVIWGLGKELVNLGHEVTYLVKKGSSSDFAKVIYIDENKDIIEQIPDDIHIVHFNFTPDNINNFTKPYLITVHGNTNNTSPFDLNTVFVSGNHAGRYGSNSFVHNGLDWDEYAKPDFSQARKYFHFLGNAAWRVKNVKGAIQTIKNTKSEQLKVLGGVRFNIKMGLRFTFSPRIQFYGMVGGAEKDRLLNGSKGLVFPVRWHEPFGLAIIESLYFGCPVFGTPYGALPEIVKPEFGYCSNRSEELSNAIENWATYNRKSCHEYALAEFNSKKMALSYLERYERVLANETLNSAAPRLKAVQTEKFLDWE